ncbi:MAG: hypothetical protein JWR18_3340 [Segetibacter sp.]|nr:hypothetical protein [Segetibacter sp.]
MLLTLIACSFFLFLTLTIGNWMATLLDKKLQPTYHSIFENLLLGFAFITCYLNIWSLFLPAAFFALIPIFIFSIVVCKNSFQTVIEVKRRYSAFINNSILLVALPLLLVILVYALLPPQHGDSPGYHFLSIRWNEEYKAVPGLANLHGRLGFNSSFFVSSAAFAFSRLAGQPLYVLNIVFVLAYYLWLINKIYLYKSSLWSIVFIFVAIAMFRQLIDSISSPTPDVLSSIIISYVFITVAESQIPNKQIEHRQCVVLISLVCFALIVKLNTLPLSLVGLFLFLNNSLYKSKRTLLLICSVGFIILVPWLVRNYVLSGYFIFPVSATGFLHPDWKVPYEILHFEKLLINNGPKLISQNWEEVNTLSFTQWLPLWIRAHPANGLTFSLIILVIASLGAIVTVALFSRKKTRSLLWLAVINLMSILFWLYNSPDYRFGYPYLINSFLLLSLYLTRDKPLSVPIKVTTGIAVIMVGGYYLKHAANILSVYEVSTYAVRPLQARQYDPKKPAKDFPFIMLNDHVKLYVEDSTHSCNMGGLPCYIPFTDSLPATQLQLRGSSIEDGFRIQRNKR